MNQNVKLSFQNTWKIWCLEDEDWWEITFFFWECRTSSSWLLQNWESEHSVLSVPPFLFSLYNLVIWMPDTFCYKNHASDNVRSLLFTVALGQAPMNAWWIWTLLRLTDHTLESSFQFAHAKGILRYYVVIWSVLSVNWCSSEHWTSKLFRSECFTLFSVSIVRRSRSISKDHTNGPQTNCNQAMCQLCLFGVIFCPPFKKLIYIFCTLTIYQSKEARAPITCLYVGTNT